RAINADGQLRLLHVLAASGVFQRTHVPYSFSFSRGRHSFFSLSFVFLCSHFPKFLFSLAFSLNIARATCSEIGRDQTDFGICPGFPSLGRTRFAVTFRR